MEDFMRKGLLFSFEGIDGGGKTSVLGKLGDYLESLDYKVLRVREPGGTQISEGIREILLNNAYTEMDRMSELLLFMAARNQITKEKIIPALKEGYIVLADRFIDSSVAYQGFGNGVDVELVVALNRIATDGVLPDATFWFDVSLTNGMARVGVKKDRIESLGLDFMMKVMAGYQAIWENNSHRVIRIDANRDFEEVYHEVWSKALGYVMDKLG